MWLSLEESALFHQTNDFEIAQPRLLNASFEVRASIRPNDEILACCLDYLFGHHRHCWVRD